MVHVYVTFSRASVVEIQVLSGGLVRPRCSGRLSELRHGAVLEPAALSDVSLDVALLAASQLV